jgi:hypothetical protein
MKQYEILNYFTNHCRDLGMDLSSVYVYGYLELVVGVNRAEVTVQE